MHAMQAFTVPCAIAAVLGAILALVPMKSTDVSGKNAHDYSLSVIQIASKDSTRNLPIERIDDMTLVDPGRE